jgi:glycosyltransferase involved in cell wall biosynthesis
MAATNDVATDQRVLKIANTLTDEGHVVTIRCQKLPNRPLLPEVRFSVIRKKIWIKKGPFFYAFFNITLFFDLLFSKMDIITANDLDTLPACALAAALKRKALIYDSHELFTELPELIDRPRTKQFWALLEKICIRKVDAVSTVCNSIAKIVETEYNKPCVVIRNIPLYKSGILHNNKNELPQIKTLLYQGSLNMGRGIEKMIEAMIFLDDYKLIIAGTGYMEEKYKKMVVDMNLSDKISFTGLLSPDALYTLTQTAQLGFSLEEKICKNYEYALPNKLFDYIQARVPVLVSNLPEMATIVEEYKVGAIIELKESLHLAILIKNIFEHEQLRKAWKNNCNIAASELCWEKERTKLIEMYNTVISQRCN